MHALRSLFGPSRKEVWKQLADKLQGEYSHSFWKGDKIAVDVGQWTITLDTYTVSTGQSAIVYTRMRAPYVNPDQFRFTIHRAHLFSSLGRWLGMQDIPVHVQPFDKDFVIKSNDEEKIRLLLADPTIRELIAHQPRIRLAVKDDEGWFGADFPDGVDELYFEAAGVIKDPDLLYKLYELFAAVLDRLCRIGSAYEGHPGVDLK